MFLKRLIALTLFATLAVMPPCVLRAQWVPTNGIYGGEINSFAGNANSLFVCISGNVYRSTNNGMSWLEANSGMASGEYTRTLFSDGNRVFSGSDNNYSANIYIWSEDSLKWDKKESLNGQLTISSFGLKDTFLFAATSGGILRSTNSGSTWVAINTQLRGATCFAVIDTFILAGMDGNGVFRSSDQGDHWTRFDSLYYCMDIYSLAAIGKNLFAGSNNGVLLSTDYGMSWDSVWNGLSGTEVDGLAVIGGKIIAGTWQGIYTTSDNGSSWQASSNGIPAGIISTLDLSGDTLFAGTSYYGVFRSIDTGRTWTAASIGLTSMEANVFTIEGNYLFAGLWRSDDLGMNWNWTESNSANYYDYISDQPSAMISMGPYLIAGSGGIFRSSDNGTSWDTVNIPSSNGSIQAMAVKGSKVFVGTDGSGAFVSSDSGASWVEANGGLPPKSRVASLCAAGNDIVAGLENGVGITSGIFFSSNDGETWSSHNGSQELHIISVAAIDTIVFAGAYGGGLYRSSVNDTTWVGLALPSYNVSSFAIIDTTIFAGTQQGIFASYNNGDNWIKVDSGITYPYILSLAVFDSILFAGTYTEGANNPSIPTVWRRPLSQITKSPYTLGITGTDGDTINFGTIHIGRDSLRIVTITNTGKSALTISSFQLTQSQTAFATSDLSSEVVLQPGEHFTFEAYFQPTEPESILLTLRSFLRQRK